MGLLLPRPVRSLNSRLHPAGSPAHIDICLCYGAAKDGFSHLASRRCSCQPQSFGCVPERCSSEAKPGIPKARRKSHYHPKHTPNSACVRSRCLRRCHRSTNPLIPACADRELDSQSKVVYNLSASNRPAEITVRFVIRHGISSRLLQE
jgi:hypothetical protein